MRFKQGSSKNFMKNLLITLICTLGIGFLANAQTYDDFDKAQKSARLIISKDFEINNSQFYIPKALIRQRALARNIPFTLILENGDLAEIQYFDELEKPVYYKVMNTSAAKSTGTDALQVGGLLGLNLSGKGMVVGIYDQTRAKADHVEFGDRMTQIDGSTETISNHATHVSGTILAAGVNANAKGMANEAIGWAFNWESDLSKMNSNAYDPITKPGGHLVSNHSYGLVLGWFRNASNAWVWAGNPSVNEDKDYRFGYYSFKSRGLDDLVFSKPYYTVVWAAGNDRNDAGDGTRDPDGPEDTIGPEGVAKNVITVGAVANVSEYLGPQSVNMSSFSSWGPTDDGRIKPDLVGVGVGVFSAAIADAGLTDSYASQNGTSMAAPNVSGSLLLLQQLFAERNNGRFMKASTVKALAINTTKEAGLSAGPDYIYGWGLLDAKAAAEIILEENGSSNVIVENNLANDASYEFEFLSDGIQPIRVSIAWTDPSGNPATVALNPTDLMLVNDLDMRITDEEGITYFPWTLDPKKGPGSAAISDQDNFRDNVEQILITTPKSQKYKVKITHKDSLVNGSQDFSLVMKAGVADGAEETLYWIGEDQGSWIEPSNWAFSANGNTANKIPSSSTRVVFEGSSGGVTTVNFSSDAKAFSVNLFGNQTVNFDLKGNQINLSNGFRVSNQITAIKNGTMIFETNKTNEQVVELGQAIFENTNLIFKSGNWRIISHEKLDILIIEESNLSIQSDQLRINGLVMNGGGELSGNLSKIVFEKNIEIGNSAKLKENINLAFKGIGGIFQNLNTTHFDSLVLTNGKLAILSQGLNSLSLSDGEIVIQTPVVELQNLIIGRGAILNLGDKGEITVLNQISTSASTAFKALIIAGSKGKLNHDIYQKYCFENIDVLNVDHEGKAIFNLGTTASVTNSTGWLTQICSEVLFAKFSGTYPCVGAAFTFQNLSEGAVENYKWDFGGLGSSTLQNPIFVFATAGIYLVKLEISNAQGSTTFTTSFTVGANELPKPTIVVNGSVLTSLQPGNSYQWYINGEIVPGATARSFESTEDGKYQVAIFDDACNRISDAIVISALPDQQIGLSRFGIFVGPNPSLDKVTVTIANEYNGSIEFQISDMTGRILGIEKVMKTAQEASIELTLPPASGLYILRISTEHLTFTQKLIKH